jgi:quercetin dioxygenase-like cupin family protein
MRIVRSPRTSEEPMAPDHFDGTVSRRDLGAVGIAEGSALLVRFTPGARTHWHAHPNGQVLYVTEGHGRVGTRDGTVEELATGDLVVAPPGEEHWHGAAAEREVVHLALSFGDTEWFEPVGD